MTHDGALDWQQQLNDKNHRFFQVTDGFFTDYKWNPDLLRGSQQNFEALMRDSGRSTFDLFCGNDVFGRGTFGGGQLSTYKAVDEILKFPFSIALFGQEFWYENLGGHRDPRIFQLNEDMFWKGKDYRCVADSNGKRFLSGETLDEERARRHWKMKEDEWKTV